MSTCEVIRRLTGYLLDLVDHHKGVRQAHLHRVIDGADLRHLGGDLKGRKSENRLSRDERNQECFVDELKRNRSHVIGRWLFAD